MRLFQQMLCLGVGFVLLGGGLAVYSHYPSLPPLVPIGLGLAGLAAVFKGLNYGDV